MLSLEPRYDKIPNLGNYDRLTSLRGPDGKVCDQYITYPNLNDLSVIWKFNSLENKLRFILPIRNWSINHRGWKSLLANK